MSRPVKRSLTLGRHRTSVSLEDAFWQGLKDAAASRGMGINALAAEIDAKREVDTGLATAIRLFVLHYYKDRAAR